MGVLSFFNPQSSHSQRRKGEDLLHVLNDKSRSAAAAVADTGNTNLGVLLLQNGGKGGDDTSARAAERVANGNGSAPDIHLLSVKTELLDVGEGDDGESLVDLVEVDILLGKTGVLDGLGDGESRSNGESLGLALGITPAEDLGEGLETELLDLGLGGEDNSGSTVVDGGGVGGGDSAVGLEGGADGLQLVGVEVLDFVVALNLDVGLAAAAADLDGDDLLEQTGLGGSLGLLVALDGVLVLGLTREVVVLGAQLGGHAHVLLAVGISETVLEDAVDEGLVAVLGASAEVGQVVRGVGHRLGTAGDDDVGGAEHDVLRTEDDGLEGGGAHLVDGG